MKIDYIPEKIEEVQLQEQSVRKANRNRKLGVPKIQ